MLVMLAGFVAEAVVLLLALLAVSWFRNRAARRRDAQAMQALVARIRKGKGEREMALQGFLGEQLGLPEESRQPVAAALRHAELTLLQDFITVFPDFGVTDAVYFGQCRFG